MVNDDNPFASLDFTCVKEARPPLPTDTQQLYNYALYQDLHNLWNGEDGDKVWQEAAVYYRIAAANGDYKANTRLQYLIKDGRVKVKKPQTEVYNLNKLLESQLPATAFYNLSNYLKDGYGVTTQKNGHYAYLRKAADMGSREAQYTLAKIFLSIEDKASLQFRLKVGDKLFACASEQGLPEASEELGLSLQIDKKYSEAVKVFHQGTKNGNALSARRLMKAFSGKASNKHGRFSDSLDLSADLERSKRYDMIENYLYNNDFLHPKVPDLDEIVPLPPARLPAWDGKIAFQRWFEGPSPAKPSDELMQQLAEKAGLDVKTGLPLKKR
ncbi:sel1 repeat family protein [Aggregatibacter actinomycetemcomitans]|uniref:SEL1-like repeat protein n=1 Tax=Aggregatibacter actinomycetemcomitans TaxID=714 RepID=UPI00197BBDF1|nr:DUF6396 domain-containing protein [Aggregatibacter actinomycetemcomitans]MBN6076042.1 sel1 repeat family protein [Aggregatibacter actinomycetemcomitans]